MCEITMAVEILPIQSILFDMSEGILGHQEFYSQDAARQVF
jgi:hypothetical protein